MKAYKYYYNEEKKEINLVEYHVDDMYDFDHEPDVNLSDIPGHFVNYKDALNGVFEVNEKLRNRTCKLLKCKDCGKYFIMSDSEEYWFTSRDMTPPKRCINCRNKRKKERAEKNKE